MELPVGIALPETIPLPFSISQIILTTTFVVTLLRYFIYPAFLSPLSKYPAVHWTCHFSPLWSWWAKCYGWENRRILAAHREKGYIVRVAPNSIHINSAEGLKTIYMGDFPRAKFYWAAFKNYETPHMVAMPDADDHNVRRKLFSTAFNKSAVLTSPTLHIVCKTVLFKRFLPALHRIADTEMPFEVFKMIYGVAMDLFVGWQFGLASSSNWTEDTEDRDRYLEAYNHKAQYFFRSVETFDQVTILQRLGINFIPKDFWTANDVCEDWNIDLCDRAAQTIADGRHIDAADEPVLFRHALKTMCGLENGQLEKGTINTYPRRLEIAAEMFSFNAAAHEGGAIPLTWITYEMSRRPSLQDKLRKELESLKTTLRHPAPVSDDLPLPSQKEIESLPLLDAIIMETMRRYPVISGPLPRVAPSDFTLGGNAFIPKGTQVACSAWSLHRNPEVFPNPEEWNPERWLKATPEQLYEMRKWFWAFGSGSMMCIGSHFALFAVKTIVALLYSNFTTSIYHEGDMTHQDAYLSGPIDQEEFLILLRAL
ncbi:cytochrome P450 [Mariannaea sp. PMI_226]|nr:cytochrome P450 [Mariannaea sp. PMI_226]